VAAELFGQGAAELLGQGAREDEVAELFGQEAREDEVADASGQEAREDEVEVPAGGQASVEVLGARGGRGVSQKAASLHPAECLCPRSVTMMPSMPHIACRVSMVFASTGWPIVWLAW